MTAVLGALFLVPNTLDLGSLDAPDIGQVLPAGVLQHAARLEHWVAEDAKTTRAFLKRVAAVVPLARTMQSIDIRELPRPLKGTPGGPKFPCSPRATKGPLRVPGGRTPQGGGLGGAQKGGHSAQPAVDLADWLSPALAGADIGLISEAGLPGVADPGAALVAAAHRLGIAVLPLAGPSSLMLALAASGLNGQNFAFVGYLPTDPAERAERVLVLQQQSRRERQTQIAIETPYRNAALMSALVATLHPDTQLAVACGLTVPSGWCLTRSVAQWRQQPPSFDGRALPAVFLWLAA